MNGRFFEVAPNVPWLFFVADKQTSNIELKTKLINTNPTLVKH